ncbi:MAG: hypothetical protein ACOYCA_04855 [Eggerthellaceae bacterium]|jgi:hypothetical protein
MTKGPMIAYILLLAVWGASLYYRCSDRKIRRQLIVLDGLLILWLILVLVKYSLDSPFASSIVWYLYYTPMLFIPAVCLSMAFRASSLEQRPAIKKLESAIYTLCGALALLFLTNNIHHLAFVFEFSLLDWGTSYHYGPLYWVGASAILVMFLSFIGILAFSSKKKLRQGIAFLITLLAIGALFSVFYILKVKIFFTTNFSLFFVIFISIAIELCLDFGLLPSFLWYKDTFYGLPLDIQLLSQEGKVIDATKSHNVDSKTEAKVQKILANHPGESSFTDNSTPDKTLRFQQIAGGYAMLVEDKSVVNNSTRELTQINNALMHQYEILKRERNIDSSLRQAEFERDLLAQIESSLSEMVKKIGELLDEAEGISDEENHAERLRLFGLARILVGYCKRKGSLILSRNDNEDFNAARLNVILNETAGDLRSTGIDCAALVETKTPLSADEINTFYDCLYDFIIKSFSCKNATIMLFLSDNRSDTIELRALLECEPEEKDFWNKWHTDLDNSLGKRNVMYRIEATQGSAKLVVAIRHREGK